MGFWSWLFGKLSEPSSQAPTERSVPKRNVHANATTALLEPRKPDHDAESATGNECRPWFTPAPSALLELAEPRLPECEGDAIVLENILISHFDGHDLSMPMLHNVAERVLPMIRGVDSNLPAAAREIGEDQVLAAAVLRTVNSPLYRGVEKISSVQRAVARLGVRTLRTLLMHQSLRGAIFDRRGAASRFADMLWTRSLASAGIMRGLARFTGMDQDEAYLLGLLHDIGSVIVLRIVQNEEKGGFADVDLDTFEYLCRQSHQEFGELVAQAWGLPPDVKSLIADHHRHPAADDPLRKQRLMLILTEMISAGLHYAPPENYNLLEATAARELGLSSRPDYVNWLTALPAEIDEFIAES